VNSYWNFSPPLSGSQLGSALRSPALDLAQFVAAPPRSSGLGQQFWDVLRGHAARAALKGFSSLSLRYFAAFEAEGHSHSRRGQSGKRRPREGHEKQDRALKRATARIKARRSQPTFWPAPFRAQTLFAVSPGASLGALPPSTMAEASSLNCRQDDED
jgi:hypothetical protein